MPKISNYIRYYDKNCDAMNFNIRNFLYQPFILYEECAKSLKILKKNNITSKKLSRLKLKKKKQYYE